MPEPRLVYWDACVFLSYIQQSEERIEALDAMLDDAGAGLLHIVTSVMSQVEVAYVEEEKASGQLDSRVEQAIDDLFFDNSVVTLVEYHPIIGRDARDLIRAAIQQGRSIKPMDAIHLATAKHVEAGVLYTYDDRMLKAGDLTGIKIEEPNVLRQGRLGEEATGRIDPA